MCPSVLTMVSWTERTEKFCNPVEEGIVTSSCGARQNPILEKQEFHDGLDIAMPEGTAVVAVKSGTVTEIRQSQTLGLVLEYETTDGFVVQYAHLQDVLVTKEEKIKQGQTIAESGNSGLSTGPHLHYSLRKDEIIVDPMSYVSLPYTAEVSEEYEARGESMPPKQ